MNDHTSVAERTLPSRLSLRAEWHRLQFARRALGLAVATLATVAFAVTRLPVEPADVPPPPPTTPPPPPVTPTSTDPQPPRYPAPTASLTTIANAFYIKTRSVTSLIVIPAGLNLAVPVTVTARFGANGSDITQSYQSGSELHFFFNYPELDGMKRRESVRLIFQENVSGGSTYQVTINFDLKPLYTVQVSPLTFTLLDDGDFFGKSECMVTWSEPDGLTERHLVELTGGSFWVFNTFARTFYEVSRSDPLYLPVLLWWEEDLNTGVPFHLLPSPSAPLINGPSSVTPRFVAYTLDDDGTRVDATAYLEYNILVRLQTYLPWTI